MEFISFVYDLLHLEFTANYKIINFTSFFLYYYYFFIINTLLEKFNFQIFQIPIRNFDWFFRSLIFLFFFTLSRILVSIKQESSKGVRKGGWWWWRVNATGVWRTPPMNNRDRTWTRRAFLQDIVNYLWFYDVRATFGAQLFTRPMRVERTPEPWTRVLREHPRPWANCDPAAPRAPGPPWFFLSPFRPFPDNYPSCSNFKRFRSHF